jgi:SAM-dependent methyltransferase
LTTDVEAVYKGRFDAKDAVAKHAIWREVCRFLQQWVPEDGAVLDIAADEGYFIGNIRAAERWATDIRDTSASLPSDVRFVQADGLALRDHLPLGHFDTVFMSNYLEHLPSSTAVLEQVRVARDLLKPGGRLIILQPNIRLTGAAYWDFIDHKTPLTERSLEEAAAIGGLRTVRTIVRFLPYTTKSRLPQSPQLVRTYLSVPLLWRFLGQQTLMIAERPR